MSSAHLNNKLDSQTSLIADYHALTEPDHQKKTCRICFLLSEIQRWRSAHDRQVAMKQSAGRILRQVCAALKEHGGVLHVSRSTKTITVEWKGETMENPIMKFFEFAHLPAPLQEVSKPIGELANRMFIELPDCAEKSAGLRKLLEAKDCFVRAKLESK